MHIWAHACHLPDCILRVGRELANHKGHHFYSEGVLYITVLFRSLQFSICPQHPIGFKVVNG